MNEGITPQIQHGNHEKQGPHHLHIEDDTWAGTEELLSYKAGTQCFAPQLNHFPGEQLGNQWRTQTQGALSHFLHRLPERTKGITPLKIHT